MTVRDERAAALIRRHRDLADDFTRALPGLLDELDAIDQAQVHPVTVTVSAPEDAAIAEWIERNPKAFADWAAKQARINPGGPVKPATRRRTGGTHA